MNTAALLRSVADRIQAAKHDMAALDVLIAKLLNEAEAAEAAPTLKTPFFASPIPEQPEKSTI